MKRSSVLVLALCAQLAWAQPVPQNLVIPVNHAGTGIAHDLGYDFQQPYNLYVFDAKTQPSRVGQPGTQYAYLRLKFQPVPNPFEILYMSPDSVYMYPAYIYRGATQEGGEQQSYMELQAASYKGIGPSLVNGYAHAWGPASWNPTFWYTYERESRVTAICTPSATPDCGWLTNTLQGGRIVEQLRGRPREMRLPDHCGRKVTRPCRRVGGRVFSLLGRL